MSKRRACRTGKKRYHSADEAKRAITNVKFNVGRSLADTGSMPQRTYRCEFCGGYHLTSRDERTVIA